MISSPSRRVVEVLSPAFVILAALAIGNRSELRARPARQADDRASTAAKSANDADHAKSIRVAVALKQASRPASAWVRTAQQEDQPGVNASILGDERVSARRGRVRTGKAKRISIPLLSLLQADRVHDFHATAYCLKGRTASGHQVREGVIAADPRLLPLGTVVQLQAGRYTGIYTVLDTGGRIKGRLIDVYVPTRKEALQFGRRHVKLKVIGRVKPGAEATRMLLVGGQF